MRPNGRSPVPVFGSPSCAFPPHRHVEDLLEAFELVGLEVEGDLPLVLQQGDGRQELVSSYLVLCSEVILRFPWTCKNYKIISMTTLFSKIVLKQCVLPISTQPLVGPSIKACPFPRPKRMRRTAGNQDQGSKRDNVMLRSSTSNASVFKLTL